MTQNLSKSNQFAVCLLTPLRPVVQNQRKVYNSETSQSNALVLLLEPSYINVSNQLGVAVQSELYSALCNKSSANLTRLVLLISESAPGHQRCNAGIFAWRIFRKFRHNSYYRVLVGR